MDNVVPINVNGTEYRSKITGKTPQERYRQAVELEKAERESASRHPAGKRIKPHQRCPDCGHTLTVHTDKAHDGAGGCAYCKCQHKPSESP